MSTFLGLFDISLLNAMLRISVPLILASLCYAVCAQAGVIDMGLEGKMLFGAFSAVLMTQITGSPILGLLLSLIMTASIAGLIGLVMVKLHAQQVIVGIGFNFFMQGLTTVMLAAYWGNPGNSEEVPRLGNSMVKTLATIPGIGKLFRLQTNFLPLTLVIIVLISIWLFYTKSGLRLRSVGENPIAADCQGISVHRYRILACIIGGMLCGLAGADLSLGQLGYFAKDMTAGRGYMALSCAIVGRYKPSGLLVSSLLIAFIDALQMRMQAAFAIPPQFMQMIPFIVPVLVISGFGGAKPPSSLGKPYIRGER